MEDALPEDALSVCLRLLSVKQATMMHTTAARASRMHRSFLVLFFKRNTSIKIGPQDARAVKPE